MNKLIVLVPFYKRHRLTKLCFKRLKSQSKKLGFEVVVAGSEGEESKKLAKGLHYIEVPNQPLSNKLNALLNECREFDGVIVLGSDNFISDSIIKMYQEMDLSKNCFYSFDDIYIYSQKHKELRSDFAYTRNGNGIGVARLFPKKVLEKVDYKLWKDGLMSGLDGSAQNTLKEKKVKENILPLKDHYIFDIKIEENITYQDVVKSGNVKHELTLLNKLGAIGKEILALEPEAEEVIYKQVKKKIQTTKCKVIKSFHQFKEGDTVHFPKYVYQPLIDKGYLTLVDE